MNSGYFYGREQVGEVSLLLKQLKIGPKRILFALIGVGVSKDWIEYLSRWFYQKVSSVENKEILKNLEKGLLEEIPIPRGAVFGIFLYGGEFLAFGQKDVLGAWMYRRFLGFRLRSFLEGVNWENAGDVSKEEGWRIACGFLEKGGGILLCTREYLEGTRVEELGPLLLEGKRISDKQIGKRLGEGTMIQGGAAIFIRI